MKFAVVLYAAGNGSAAAAIHARPPGGPVSDTATPRAALSPSLAIQPMTTVGPGGAGYFSDPYPVRLAPSRGSRTQVISGTTKAIMSCVDPISARCFSWTPASIEAGILSAEIASAGASIVAFQNLNIFQDDRRTWHAVLAITVHSAAYPKQWTVLVHAHPSTHARSGRTPIAWSADTVLSGSFSTYVDGNYDGKYLEDHGRLYLLYVKNFAPEPAPRNGIVIQAMSSPTQLGPDGPITLLLPGEGRDALKSEWFDHTSTKLLEAPFITTIAGKYALIYSTGAYHQVDYKAGIAWSDTLIPARGGQYRKVLQPDAHGVWGPPGRPEVRYLLQSQTSRWPNFTGAKVISPGVASAVRPSGGAWRLYFAGFDPADRPLVHPGVADADHRRPFFVRLRAAVPQSQTVAGSSDAELAKWLRPETR